MRHHITNPWYSSNNDLRQVVFAEGFVDDAADFVGAHAEFLLEGRGGDGDVENVARDPQVGGVLGDDRPHEAGPKLLDARLLVLAFELVHVEHGFDGGLEVGFVVLTHRRWVGRWWRPRSGWQSRPWVCHFVLAGCG